MSRIAFLACACCCLIAGVPADEIQPAVSQPAGNNPPLEFTKWSGRINVPDPVAISLDNHGRAYVTQTQRRKLQDLDLREHREWTADDLSLQSIDDKRAFYHRTLAPGNEAASAKHIGDLNSDGHHDYRDLMVVSEKIHRLEDSDGDGTADAITTFADDFRTEVTGIAAGVLADGDTVYATIAPDVWKLRDTDGDGVADDRELLATGFGLHIAYGGHDMHGLTVGPDGKIYWSIGDKAISVMSKEGRRFHYPNQGGVMRCNPDGTDFEVFAHGLRNVQEPTFDQFGNLFGVDNDSDNEGEKERFVYIVRGMDAGWRFNYQLRESRYNPWMAEGIWETYHEGQPAHVIPPISYSIDGPAGCAFNPGTALSPVWRDYFFLTGAPNGNQIAFQVQPDGASFRMVNEQTIGNGIPLVGINFGPDGALYGVDWGGGYPLNQTGAVWKIDDPASANSDIRAQVRELLGRGLKNQETAALVGLLSHADQRIRLNAQFELVNRNAVGELIRTATAHEEQLAGIHAVWGLGQLARQGSQPALTKLTHLLVDNDPEIVAQAVRVIGDLKSFNGRLLLSILANKSPRVQFAVASALGDHPTPDAVPSLVEFSKTLRMSDTYLRFALVRALASCAASDQLQSMRESDSELLRLAAVVALRQQASPLVVDFLYDKSEVVATDAARAIHDDFSIPAALPELAEALTDPVYHNEAFLRRASARTFGWGSRNMRCESRSLPRVLRRHRS
ncbi:MAG: HEAT repeat domain-containing protein [Planctomycetaceae bacterium]